MDTSGSSQASCVTQSITTRSRQSLHVTEKADVDFSGLEDEQICAQQLDQNKNSDFLALEDDQQLDVNDNFDFAALEDDQIVDDSDNDMANAANMASELPITDEANTDCAALEEDQVTNAANMASELPITDEANADYAALEEDQAANAANMASELPITDEANTDYAALEEDQAANALTILDQQPSRATKKAGKHASAMRGKSKAPSHQGRQVCISIVRNIQRDFL
jgi:hypothetical protein